MKRWFGELLVAFQFLTRLPISRVPYEADALSRSLKFFPAVGFAIGLGASFLHQFLVLHLTRGLAALLVLLLLVLITGGLHEDALADAADAFGGGWNREQILAILHDSRIGSFGGIALVLSLLARFLLLSTLPLNRFTAFVVSAHVLSRWSTLPLSYFMPAAGAVNGQGSRITQKVSGGSMVAGSLLSVVIVFSLMLKDSWKPIAVTLCVTALSGLYYSRRLGGVTGDCFGATSQLAEIAVYFCGVWSA
jgi:adenosylcobinamide-GDP ribazoletransferase